MIRKIDFRLFTIIIMLSFLVILGCTGKDKAVLSLTSGESEIIRFPTRNVAGFKDLMFETKARNTKGLGTLYLPSTANRENKVAVMVILHGSGGEWSGRGAEHAKLLVKNGVAAFVIDTFVGRGLKKKDKYIQRLLEVNFPDQISDAFAALEFLQTHPNVDENKIGVMGYSMGGISTILTAYEEIAKNVTKKDIRFALHVPFYAPCIILPKEGTATGAPIVALWGEIDESTIKSRCDRTMDHLQKSGSPVTSIWYPNAAHSWNSQRPMKYYKGVPNFAPCDLIINLDGSITEKNTGLTSSIDKELIENCEQCVSWGYTIGWHEITNQKANTALLNAIEEYL